MEDNIQNNSIDRIENIKNRFHMPRTLHPFVWGILGALLVVFVAIGILYTNRSVIFGYLAERYYDRQEETANEDGNQGSSIKPFTQESYVVDAVEKSNPAVVSIVITKDVPKYETYFDSSNPFSRLFPGFLFQTPRVRQDGTEEREVGGGSGFLVSPTGHIVTNRHVVSDEDAKYTVYLNDGKSYEAKVLAIDAVMDIAVIKIDGSNFTYLEFGDSDSLRVGQSVIAIGNALSEFRNTVSVGVISGLARSITAGDSAGNSEVLDQVIQTDAAINPGNSGGPLLNLSGRVIGVNVAVAQGSENIGFALPGNSVKSIVDSVRETGKIIRPYLGVRYVLVNTEIKESNNLSVDYGVLVRRGESSAPAVIPGSPADEAGILEGDVIIEFDGRKIDEDTSLAALIRGKNVGDTVKIRIIRKGIERTLNAKLEAAPDNL